MTPSVSSFKSSSISKDQLLQFFDSGRNIYIGVDGNSKMFAKEFFKEFGAELYPEKSKVTGPSGKEVKGTDKSNVVWTNNINEEVKKSIVNVDSDIAYEGCGMKLDESNAYVFPILKGTIDWNGEVPPRKTKSKEIKRDVAGLDVVAVAGYQSRYSQRVVMSVSITMCSDNFIAATSTGKDYRKSSNFKFCSEVLKWNFQQKSVLKMEKFNHSLVDRTLIEKGLQNEQEYKLKDEIQVTLDIYEKVNGKWVPYKTNEVELEFIMLSPYVVTTLQNTEGAHYRTQFHAPDWNGVYKFKIDFNKLGYTRLLLDKITPVRVFNHDEFPTYSPSAYPFFGAVYLITIAFILFSLKFAFADDKLPQAEIKEESEKKESKKTKQKKD
jgi:oligosaccharyltransferase complex subunit beta